jgi:hypothetical protein
MGSLIVSAKHAAFFHEMKDVDNGFRFFQQLERAMGQSKRIRRGKAGWLRLFSQQSSSGLSEREFCGQEGISAALFRRWRLRLGGLRGDSHVVSRKQSESSAPFIDLGGLRPTGLRLEVRLDLGGGMVLSIARG